MKIKQEGLRGNHQWNRYTLVRVVLAVVSLIGMVLASGAPSQWT